MPAAGDDVDANHVRTRVATAPLTANSVTWTTTETGALITATGSVVTGETYRITLKTTVASTVGALAEAAFMRIREDTAAGTQLDGVNLPIPNTNGNGFPLVTVVEYTAVTTGSKSFVVTGSRISGATGTQNIVCSVNRPTLLTVDRIVT